MSSCNTKKVLFILLFCFNFIDARIYVISPENKTIDEIVDWEWLDDEPLPQTGLKGYAVLSNPKNACDTIKPAPVISNSTMKLFALIQRFDCSLELKVRMAQAADYDAAIIYNYSGEKNYSNSNHLSQSIFSGGINIPAVVIKQSDGEKIIKNYLYSSKFYLHVVPNEKFDILAYIVPFAIAVGICFLMLMLFVIIKCIREYRKNRRNRLSSRNLKKLPVIKFKKGDQYDTCAICLEEYNEGNKLRVLPCSHAYHTKCIDPWLTNNRRTCPICKRKIRLDGDSSESESDSEVDTPNETTPLLRNLAARTFTARLAQSLLSNPVINRNDIHENSNNSSENNPSAIQERTTLEQQAGSFFHHRTSVELHHPSESHNDDIGVYSSSAPLCQSGLLSVNDDNEIPSDNLTEDVSVLSNTAPSTSIQVTCENDVPTDENSQNKQIIV